VPNHILTALHITKFSELYLVGNKISEVDGLHRLLKLHLMKRRSQSLVPRLVENILGLGKKPVTRNPNPEYPNPNPKYPKPEFCSGISGSNLQNPKLFRVIRVSQSGTRNTRITRTFMCHVLMSCLIINLYIYNYV
jgi:hypothetical protein